MIRALKRFLGVKREDGPMPWRPERPAIVISSCKSARETGDFVYNGGVKLYNLWVRLLREHGYPAFVMTYDGRYADWLIDHQPHVSFATVEQWRRKGIPVKYVTGWLDATAFVECAASLYFFDAEMTATCGPQRPLLAKLARKKIRSIATHSRTQQAWHMAQGGRPVMYIPEWSDTRFWRPDPARRHRGRIGYMDEGPHTRRDTETVAVACRKAGVPVELVEVKGDEREVIAAMQSCDIYLGLNPGKHPLWGEGCPRSQQEAMHAGCVLIAYDVNGNREYAIDGYTALLARRGDPEALAGLVVGVMKDESFRETLRLRSQEFVSRAFSSENRWPLIREFLELEESCADTPEAGTRLTTREAVERYLGGTAFINDAEVPLLAKYGAMASRGIVEIGAAFGGSALVLLSSSSDVCPVTSIDPFVKDSMGEFQADAALCRRNVLRGLEAVGRPRAYGRWCLLPRPSHEVAQEWQRAIDLLYLDGDHHYPATCRDFFDWSGFVAIGGHIVLHDSRREGTEPDDVFSRGWPGPSRLAADLREHACVALVDEAFSMTVWRRTGAPCSQCMARKVNDA